MPSERQPSPRCSIIIPVYNRASLTKQCLDTLLHERPSVSIEIIVVDDGSRDHTRQLLAGYGDAVVALHQPANAGFAAACNAGAARARADLLVFLNNDTVPAAGWLDALVAYADQHPDVAMIGARLLFPNDTVQHCGVMIAQDRFPRHLYAGLPATHPAVNHSRPVQVVTAACALVRRAVFESLAGFDTAFVNGYEDVDFCLRLGARGHAIHYCHAATLTHLESVSVGRFDHLAHNTQLYIQRWQHRVQPDDMRYYLADGLIQLDYAEQYPIRLTVAPELAELRPADGLLSPPDELLAQRARQAHALLKDNIALRVQVLEAQAIPAGGRQPDTASPGAGGAGTPSHPTVVAWGRERPLTDSHGPLLSIVVPTKNGLAGLRRLLPEVFRQQCRARVEIVAVDSGSTDGTVAYLGEQGATVVRIAPEAFNHGLTRGLAAEFARGRVLVYVNQQTLPGDEWWLARLIAPFDDDAELVGVCSRVLPHATADPLTRRDALASASASSHARTIGVRDSAALAAMTPDELRLLINFHTVSAAIKPQALLRVPFRAVTIGEDILWAKEVLAAGYRIRHESSSVVYHSHDYGYLDLFRRNVDDGLANRAIVGRTLDETTALAGIRALVASDWQFVRSDLGLTGAALDDALLDATVRRVAQMAGQWLGINRDRLPADLDTFTSLTAAIRRGGDALRPGG